MIYLDYNATTPLDPEVYEEIKPFLEPGVNNKRFGNPSSSHALGTVPRQAVRNARNQVADLLNTDSSTIIFTSGGSESNNTVLKGVSEAFPGERNHVIVSSIEHPAILEPCAYLENHGYEVTYLPVDKRARIDPQLVAEALRPDTLLISIMHSNNEVGTLQPIKEISNLAAKHGTLVHTDASQSVGKVPVDVDGLGVDFLTVAGHKLYAPKGIGALYVRNADVLDPLVHGADQENGRRAGTENVPMAVGLGKACEISNPQQEAPKLRKLRDILWRKLKQALGDDVVLNGHPDKRLPNTVNVNFVGHEAEAILRQIPELAASTGSACHSDRVELSPVLEAMGIDPKIGKGAIRLSTGRFTKREDVLKAAEFLVEAVNTLSQ